MNDKKLTDSKIVKALECCNTEYDGYQCPHCPLIHKGCKKALIQNALDLINRLQAENERLKDYTITVEKEVDWYRDELRHSDKKVATKAYKEVFQKLNDKALVRKIKLFGGWFIVKGVTLHDINTLKKELVGEESG